MITEVKSLLVSRLKSSNEKAIENLTKLLRFLAKDPRVNLYPQKKRSIDKFVALHALKESSLLTLDAIAKVSLYIKRTYEYR